MSERGEEEELKLEDWKKVYLLAIEDVSAILEAMARLMATAMATLSPAEANKFGRSTR